MKTICKKCRYHEIEPTHSDVAHLCYARAEKVQDYITGEITTEGVQNCYNVNETGYCLYYEKSKR